MIGVVIVTYDSRDVVLDCLSTLLAAAREAPLRVVVVDNRSTDGTPEAVRAWARDASAWRPPSDLPFEVEVRTPESFVEIKGTAGQADAELVLVRAPLNAGFAGGVNRGLALLSQDDRVQAVWLLNPDAVVPPGTVRLLDESIRRDPEFGLMGGRVVYLAAGDPIQSDGGRVSLRTGRTRNIRTGQPDGATPPEPPDRVDYVMGGHLIASRRFLEAVGPMEEGYFLFYEEVDWAMRRGRLPIRMELAARVYHRAGTSTGAVSAGRRASPFSLYFSHRARLMFVRRHAPRNVPLAQLFTLARVGKLALRGEVRAMIASLRGAFGLSPPREVRARLSPEALELIGEGAVSRAKQPQPATQASASR